MNNYYFFLRLPLILAFCFMMQRNVHFYQALEEPDDVDYNDTNKCLITHEPLDPSTAVTLECQHSFNYLPLYRSVLASKQKFNNLETKSLKASQIKCPFCRHVQNQLLPLPPMGIDAKVIHGVNVLEYSPVRVGTCCFTTTDGRGCPSTSVYLTFRDNQTYCYHHRSIRKLKWDLEDRQNYKCTYVFTRGTNKGMVCGNTITKNYTCGFCVTHAKQQRKALSSASIRPTPPVVLSTET